MFLATMRDVDNKEVHIYLKLNELSKFFETISKNESIAALVKVERFSFVSYQEFKEMFYGN
jgi:hypothetical protein